MASGAPSESARTSMSEGGGPLNPESGVGPLAIGTSSEKGGQMGNGL